MIDNTRANQGWRQGQAGDFCFHCKSWIHFGIMWNMALYNLRYPSHWYRRDAVAITNVI